MRSCVFSLDVGDIMTWLIFHLVRDFCALSCVGEVK